jgi:hypothetical protein
LVSSGARLASDETGVESICPEDKSSFPLVPFASFALRLVAVDPVDKPRTFFRFHLWSRVLAEEVTRLHSSRYVQKEYRA